MLKWPIPILFHMKSQQKYYTLEKSATPHYEQPFQCQKENYVNQYIFQDWYVHKVCENEIIALLQVIVVHKQVVNFQFKIFKCEQISCTRFFYRVEVV